MRTSASLKFPLNAIRALLCLAGALLAAGCSSTPSSGATAARVGPLTNARPVVVQDFGFEVAEVHPDQGLLSGRNGPVKRLAGEIRGTETPSQRASRLAGILSESIAKELNSLKVPARRRLPGDTLPEDGYLVGGDFLQVDEGNRLQRAIVGFGAGSTEVFVQVSIYDLARSRTEPVLVYGTGAGSRPMPGAVVTWNPYVMAAKYVLSRNATEKDVRRLGRQIARDIAVLESSRNQSPSTPPGS